MHLRLISIAFTLSSCVVCSALPVKSRGNLTREPANIIGNPNQSNPGNDVVHVKSESLPKAGQNEAQSPAGTVQKMNIKLRKLVQKARKLIRALVKGEGKQNAKVFNLKNTKNEHHLRNAKLKAVKTELQASSPRLASFGVLAFFPEGLSARLKQE